MRRFLNPANLATLLRLALAPFVARAILERQHIPALLLFFLAGLTDVIDGALARRFGWSTPTGAYLDPIVDKVLLSTVYICLALAAGLPWGFVALVFGRDLLILAVAGATLLLTNERKFPPSRWGKLSTFFQIAAAIGWMVRVSTPSLTLDNVTTLLLWTAAAATLWSGIDYGRRALTRESPGSSLKVSGLK